MREIKVFDDGIQGQKITREFWKRQGCPVDWEEVWNMFKRWNSEEKRIQAIVDTKHLERIVISSSEALFANRDLISAVAFYWTIEMSAVLSICGQIYRSS